MGIRRLGNNVGNSACSAAPMLWGSRVPANAGVTNDWTTRKWPDVGSDADGEDGKYIFKGMCRRGAP